ncbi:multicopper oxidase domain-containing protein [Cytobacillus firmus]|uniref:multicopper oxidase domain-containing protein n=1 Tax=Cytobacillus firmus TaxID=1399 RepID=UPI0037C0ED0D
MHLHGHFFKVLSKNGKPAEESPIMKVTIHLEPGDGYFVAFKADNTDNWLFRCHDLHYASAGMVSMGEYHGFKPSFTPDPNAIINQDSRRFRAMMRFSSSEISRCIT